MFVPDGYYIIFQPKYRTPCVLDLHPRGIFKTRPFVTREWSVRILADDKMQLMLQYLYLADESGADQATGERYNVILKSVLIDLDPDQEIDPEDLSQQVAREEDRTEIVSQVNEWHAAYIPRTDTGRIDAAALAKKLTASINEYKANLSKRLVVKNKTWVASALPRAIQDFRRYLHPLVRNDLHRCYREMDGHEDEAQLIQKIALLQCVYTEMFDEPLCKPDGRVWKDDDEAWACWTGFAGSAEEAHRIGRTLETVFRPVITEINAVVSAVSA